MNRKNWDINDWKGRCSELAFEVERLWKEVEEWKQQNKLLLKDQERLEWDREALEWLVQNFMCLDQDLRSPINEDIDEYRWMVRCNQTMSRESHSHDDWRDAIEEAMTCDKPFKYYGTGPANL